MYSGDPVRISTRLTISLAFEARQHLEARLCNLEGSLQGAVAAESRSQTRPILGGLRSHALADNLLRDPPGKGAILRHEHYCPLWFRWLGDIGCALIHVRKITWNAEGDNVCDLQWAHHVRGAPPHLVSVSFETRDAS